MRQNNRVSKQISLYFCEVAAGGPNLDEDAVGIAWLAADFAVIITFSPFRERIAAMFAAISGVGANMGPDLKI